MSKDLSGVYMVRNPLTGEAYVGASTQLQLRLQAHRSKIFNHGRGFGDEYRAAFLNVKSEADIEIRILEFVPVFLKQGRRHIQHYPALLERERFWIRKLKPSLNSQHRHDPIDVKRLEVGPPADDELATSSVTSVEPSMSA